MILLWVASARAICGAEVLRIRMAASLNFIER
jgi:hypothetical protein